MKEKAVEWVKNKWLIAFVIIGVLMFIARIPLAVFIGWLGGIDVDNAVSAGDLLRSFILLLGVIGGGYGLYLSVKRQKTFSDQVQVQVNQDFNDRLGRGVELLTNESIVMRCAGINVLEDLANNASEAQKSIVANIIYDFFCDKVAIKDDGDYDVGHSVENRQDLQNALDFLVGLPFREREKLLQKRIVDGRLDLRNLKFIHLHFTSELLENVDFSNSYFYESEFRNDKIINVSFCDAKFKTSFFGMDHKYYFALRGSDHSRLPQKNIIHSCDFTFAHIDNTVFCNMTIEFTEFSDIECVASNFLSVEFLRGRFYCRNDISITSKNDLPYFVGTQFASANFTFSDELTPDDFFKSCYYNVDELPPADSTNIGSSQGVKIIDEMLVFVKSGQPVEEQVAVEIVEWKIAQAKKAGKDTTGLESELKVAKKDLQVARKRQNKTKTP